MVLPGQRTTGLCIFEYVYFARTDSVIDGLSVYEARYGDGPRSWPGSIRSRPIWCAACPTAVWKRPWATPRRAALPYVPGFVKNRYIGRSFIFPTQSQRDAAVRLKLNPLRGQYRGQADCSD